MSTDQQPNILLILTDQQRFDTLSGHLNHFGAETPAMDALIERGILFENCFCTSPVCCPARSSLITGLFPSKAGMPSNQSPPLAENVITVANRLQAKGYETIYHGKSHLKTDLKHLGFETVFENSHDPSTLMEAARFYRNRDWEVFKRPFFQVVSFLDPHDIYFLDPEWEDPVSFEPWENHDDPMEGKPWPQAWKQRDWSDGRWDYYRRFYAERIQKVDRLIGVLLEELRFSGFAPDTWVIFTSDHGDMAGEHGIPFKGPYMYDSVLKVPLIVAPPHTGYVGRRSGFDYGPKVNPQHEKGLVSHVDLVPTILEMAGIEPDPELPGSSVLPVIRGEADAIESNKCIYAEWHNLGKTITPIRTIRTERWKYNHYLGIGEELYDLEKDPAEINNLAGDHAYESVRVELEERLNAHLEREEDPFYSLPVSSKP